jgi:hypothetical protein
MRSFIVCCAGNTVVQEKFMYAPWNQQRSIGGNSTALGHSAFASWNNSQPTQNGGHYVMAPHAPNISSTPFYRGVNNICASQLRGGGSVPPQPAYSVSLWVYCWIISDFHINFIMAFF